MKNQKIDLVEKMDAFKTKAHTAIDTWANQRITNLVQQNPSFAKFEPYARRAVENYMEANSDKLDKMIDNISLFVADKDGKVDVATMFDDVLNMYRTTEKSRLSIAGMNAVIGGGEVAIQIPENFFTKMFFREAGQWLTIGESDFLELKNLLI